MDKKQTFWQINDEYNKHHLLKLSAKKPIKSVYKKEVKTCKVIGPTSCHI